MEGMKRRKINKRYFIVWLSTLLASICFGLISKKSLITTILIVIPVMLGLPLIFEDKK